MAPENNKLTNLSSHEPDKSECSTLPAPAQDSALKGGETVEASASQSTQIHLLCQQDAKALNTDQPYIKYVTLKDLSIKLGGRSHSSLWRDIKHGRLPKPKGRSVRLYWIEEEVDDFLSTRRVGGPQS